MSALPNGITKLFLHKAWKDSQFQHLTKVQQDAIPLILDGKDVMAESPTGTGKTLAYVLPIVEKIDPSNKNVQMVILAPSRELVMQILAVVEEWTEGSEISSVALIGGANIKRQIERLRTNPELIVGTPGRVMELIKAKRLKMHDVKTIVLDEGDQLLINEHLNVIDSIIKTTLRDRQIVMFSATLPEQTAKLGEKFMHDPVSISVNKTEKNVDHMYFVSERRDKPDILRRLVRGEIETALTFVRDIGNLNVLSQRLEYMNIKHSVLHSEATKRERVASIQKFRAGHDSVLLATDIAARGLDIDNLSHVIHFDLPDNATQYTHRSGRTGRMGAAGTVMSIVTASEARVLRKYARELGIELKEKELYRGEIIDKKMRAKTNNRRTKKKR